MPWHLDILYCGMLVVCISPGPIDLTRERQNRHKHLHDTAQPSRRVVVARCCWKGLKQQVASHSQPSIINLTVHQWFFNFHRAFPEEYSQASLKKMDSRTKEGGFPGALPPVIDMAVCEVRHYDWPSVVTAHNGLHTAMVWSAFNKAWLRWLGWTFHHIPAVFFFKYVFPNHF